VDLELRAPRDDEMEALQRAAAVAFGSPSVTDEAAVFARGLESERCLAVFDEGAIVATAGAHSFELTVPGAIRVPVAGVSIVGVHPTHRRRGLLRWMMDSQLDDVARRGEPLAVLTASESSIYERFGYGTATFTTRWELESEYARLATSVGAPGHVRLVAGEEAVRAAHAVYEVVSAGRVGEIRRRETWWRERVYSPASEAKFFTAVHEGGDGRADGFARYAVDDHWPDGVPAKTLRVLEVHAVDVSVEAELWDYLFGIDLIGTVEAVARPVDDPLRWRLPDPRRMRGRELRDHLWVRVVDVGTALTARAYGADDALVLELTDTFRPENSGRWRIDGADDGGSCARTDDEADLSLTAPDLGALYLGGVSAATLARAGRVTERREGAVQRADRLFGVQPLPWCTTFF